MSRPLLFVDTETTGLGQDARPWEIAFVRVDGDGGVTEFVCQISYDLAAMAAMRASEEALHVGGWLTRGAPRVTYTGVDGEPGTFRWPDERAAALDVRKFLFNEPILIGVGVHFDAEVLYGLLRRTGVSASWHYGLVDLKAMTLGFLHGQGALFPSAEVLQLPLRSEQLSRAVGVEPPAGAERHTALGDVRWAKRWYDRLTGGDQ